MDWRTIGLGLRIGGHRGAAGEAPENTYAGFDLAALAGVDYLEFDVQLLADGVAVVIHDDQLDRTSDGHGPVAGATETTLARLDAGAWFDPRFAGEPVPTLAGMVRWLEARPFLGATIEAKGIGTGDRIARTIAASPQPATPPSRSHRKSATESTDENERSMIHPATGRPMSWLSAKM